MKKTLITLAISICSTSSFALEFLGQTLENTPRHTLHQLLIENGGKVVKETPLSTTYRLQGKSDSNIPYATWAKIFYAPNEQFVGLNLGFPYDQTYYLNIRRGLLEKYGRPTTNGSFSNRSNFTNEFFSGDVKWVFPNKTSIEYNAPHVPSLEPREIRSLNLPNTTMSLFYRHDARSEELKNALKEQHYKSEEKKIKKVF